MEPPTFNYAEIFDKVVEYLKKREIKDGEKLWIEKSELAFMDLNLADRVIYLQHKKLDRIVKVRFENLERQHRVKLAELISFYVNDLKNNNNENKVDVKKFIFGMIHLFASKELLGKKNGFLSKKSFVLMLLTWLVDRDYLANA